jgi:3-deoxy-D-manno-octulosonate 8-phosphate phosphatase (KDO 8-P phosphatase)
MKNVGYAIAPFNADSQTKTFAHFITERSGGDRAVSEACMHLLEKFFSVDRMRLSPDKSKPS